MNKDKDFFSNKKVDDNYVNYKEELATQKERIASLLSENEKLKSELDLYRSKDKYISSAIKDAEESACSIKKKAEFLYDSEVESLKNFSARWRNYFNYLYKKYPMYDSVKISKNIFDKIGNIINKSSGKEAITKINNILDINSIPKKVFDPKKKIEEYINATGDNGFNLDEVLNPGELKLEDLCKELGLTEDE